MENFIEFINKKSNNQYKYLKLSTVTYNKLSNTLSLVLLYPDEVGFIKEEDREKITDLLKEFVGVNLLLEIKFLKSFYDEAYLKIKINVFNKEEFPALMPLINLENLKIEQEEGKVKVTVHCFKNYISKEQIEKYALTLERFLNNEFFYEFIIEVIEEEKELNENILEKKKQEIIGTYLKTDDKRTAKVEVINQIIGSETSLTPFLVSAISTPETKISVVGTVKFFSEREFMKKQKVMDSEEERFNEVKKIYYSFVLQGAGKELNAVYFPKDQTEEKIKKLRDGQEVVVTGDVEEFNGKLSLKVKHITLVNLLEKNELEVKFKPVPANYKWVFPEDFEVVTQANLFENSFVPSEYLKNNTFVVFDLETTGLNYEDCRIVEIGAVKIESGKITKKFSTFVDPEAEIPLEATEIHGITNAMVMGAPKVGEALSDFYKFCENSTLIAYNIDFDFKFINYYGKKNGFNFSTHPQKDALIMARQYIKGLRNYKLKTVTESLGINLANAHRAYFDAAATAEVFLKLVENIK